MTRTARPAPTIRIARAAIAYSRARRAVVDLPRKADADRAARLFDAVIVAEDELLRVCAGAHLPDEKETS